VAFYDSWKDKKRTGLGRAMVDRFNRNLVRLIRRLAPGAKDFCEIGPGNGVFLRQLAASDVNYVCFEPNRTMAEELRKISPKIRVIPKMVPPVGLPAESADVVYLGHVIEHFRDHFEVHRVLSDCRRVLRKDGLLVLLFPDYLGYREDFFDIDYTHSYVTTVSRVRHLLGDAGFAPPRVRIYNAHLSGLARVLLSPLILASTLFFGLLYGIFRKEIFLKGKITFGRNVVMTAKKK
jgi:SAM-dependent methyltransferase